MSSDTPTSEVTYDEAAIVDRYMEDHMYGHSISNNYGYMGCTVACRVEALGRGIDKMLRERAEKEAGDD